MIRSFKTIGTEDVFYQRDTKAARKVCPQMNWAAARRKLEWLQSATSLNDLAQLPTGFEALKGDLKGSYSMRVNDQFRIVFEWVDGAPDAVAIVDYHF